VATPGDLDSGPRPAAARLQCNSHNRAGGSDYSLWEEIKIGWELRTKKKNWPAVGKGSAKMADEEVRKIEITYPSAFESALEPPHGCRPITFAMTVAPCL
jgi:hypothetical protein